MSFSPAGSEISGIIITNKGIRMDPEKVSCILGWETPKNLTDDQCFLRIANFYRGFIKHYLKVVTPLTRRLKRRKANTSHLFGDWSSRLPSISSKRHSRWPLSCATSTTTWPVSSPSMTMKVFFTQWVFTPKITVLQNAIMNSKIR